MIYQHTVQYYETDKMGIVHHSNHVRWLEEFRIALLDDIGFPYFSLEERGILIPVLSVETHYKIPARFGDIIAIEGRVISFTGIKFTMAYTARNQKGDVLLEARTAHGFLDDNFAPLRIKRAAPDVYEAFVAMAQA